MSKKGIVLKNTLKYVDSIRGEQMFVEYMGYNSLRDDVNNLFCGIVYLLLNEEYREEFRIFSEYMYKVGRGEIEDDVLEAVVHTLRDGTFLQDEDYISFCDVCVENRNNECIRRERKTWGYDCIKFLLR